MKVINTDIPASHQSGPSPINILLVGTQTFDWGSLREALDAINGVECIKTECADIDEAIEFLAGAELGVSMIFLDLSVFSIDYPKELFTKFHKLVPSIPIVVLTDRTDYDLIHFVMMSGAAETFSLWQLARDNDRLKNIVQSCHARARITARQHQLMVRAMDTAEEQYVNAKEESDSYNAINLAEITADHAKTLRRLAQDNTELRSERDTANSKAVRLTMPIISGPNTNAFADALRENERLKIELQKASDILSETIRKSDAVLLYAQEKGTIDLHRILEQNQALQSFNDYARQWLSGSYSSFPLPKPAE